MGEKTMGTDFFDDDLTKVKERTAQEERESHPGAARAEESSPGRLARHKEDLAGKVSMSSNELERLRRIQGELERQKAGLESLSRKQEEYERGKQEMIEKFDRSLILIEKEEVQATQLAEIMSSMRQRFRDTLGELREINEDRWPEDKVPDELNKALAVLDDAREVYKKGLAKIEASGWQNAGTKRPDAQSYDSGADDQGALNGFGYWFKVGLAVTLPLTAVLVVLFVVYLILSSRGL